MTQLLETQPKRMAHEQRLLVEHSRATPGFTLQGWQRTGAGELCLNFRLKLAVGAFDGCLVYPDLFPDVPAYIRPQRSGESWSAHQYLGSGVLCLQYGPDNWHPGVTGVDLIRSANLLLWGELLTLLEPALDPVPSRHTLTRGQDLRGSPQRLLVTAGLRAAICATNPRVSTALKFVLTYAGAAAVAIPTAIGSPLAPITDVPFALGNERYEWSGWAVPVESVNGLGRVADAAALKAHLGAAWPWNEGLSELLHLLLLHDPQRGLRAFVLSGGTAPVCQEYRAVDLGPADQQRLPTEFSVLSSTTVAIVGAGSLGSKVAVSMARSGVRRFILVDDDILAPHNLVRNELNWLDVGFAKVEALARELKRVAVGVEVETLDVRVAGQENPMLAAALSEVLGRCTLVVDATANPHAFVALAAFTKRTQTPMVWGEVFGGGGGALMARSRPGKDADALSLRAHVHGVMGTMAPAPKGQSRGYGIEAEGRVLIASDADVTALAASMTQFCLDTLIAGEESAYPVAAYLIGFRKYWVFQCPFDTVPIDCTGALQAPVEPEKLTGDEEVALAGLKNAVEAGGGAASNGSA